MEPLVVAAIVVVVLGIVVAALFFNRDAVTKRRLRKVPLTPIRRVESGTVVRVAGTIVEEGLTLRAPFSDRPCAWYGAWVEEYRSSGKSGHWHTIIHEERFTDFVIHDATGRAEVRMTDPRVASVKDVHSRSGTFDDATAVEEGFLRRHGRDSTGLLGLNRRLRYREAALELGEDVTVLGRAASAGSALGGRTVELHADPELGLLLSDDPSTLG